VKLTTQLRLEEQKEKTDDEKRQGKARRKRKFVCGILYDIVSISVEGSGGGLISVLPRYLSERNEENHESRVRILETSTTIQV
jgi:hypothetical protein